MIPTAAVAPKGNPGDSGYERVADDWYVESVHATIALLRAESFNGPVLDPACGEGRIVDVCLGFGLVASGQDLVDRAQGRFRCHNFLHWHGATANIITNPPFDQSMAFAEHALDVTTEKVAILQQLTWLEGVRRHKRLWSLGLLARVWVFSDRPNMPPGGMDIEPGGGKKAFAWYVFDKLRPPSALWQGGWITEGKSAGRDRQLGLKLA